MACLPWAGLSYKKAPTGTVGALGIFVSENLMLLRWGALFTYGEGLLALLAIRLSKGFEAFFGKLIKLLGGEANLRDDVSVGLGEAVVEAFAVTDADDVA